MKNSVQGNASKEFQLGNVKVELSKEDLENMLKEFGIEVKKISYPICCKSNYTGTVVLFESLTKGIVLNKSTSETYAVGDLRENWSTYTDKDVWEEIPYNKERGLYHGQWVWCWDTDETHTIRIRKYDAIQDCAFTCDESDNGLMFDNYSTTCPEFIKEALQDLINYEKALGTVGIKF